MEAQICAGDEG